MRESSAPARRSARRRWAAMAPYLALLLLIVTPLWAMALILAIRAGMFSLAGTPDASQVNLFLTFIGGGLATAATVLGALFTWEHNKRERHRLGLDTVIKSLDSLSVDAPPRIAGVLASMILLGQPRVAIRVLEAAWDEHQVDPATATWLIGQVISGEGMPGAILDGDRTDTAAVREAAVLLRKHASQLTGPSPRSCYFPGQFFHEWNRGGGLPDDSKRELLLAMGTMLATRDKGWWCPGGAVPDWPTGILEECVLSDDGEDARSSAAVLFSELYSHFPDRFRAHFSERPGDLELILARGAKASKDIRFQEFAELAGQIGTAWA